MRLLTERPGSRVEICRAFFGEGFKEDQVDHLKSYFEYYTNELELLQTGIRQESWQMRTIAAKTYEDIFSIVDVLRCHGSQERHQIREHLSSKLQNPDTVCLNRSINLALRLWLMINVEDVEFEGLRHGVTCVQWDDISTLNDFLHNLFLKPQWKIDSRSSRLSPHFTVTFMQSVCGLSITWTSNLKDHLRLDRENRVLHIFPYQCYLQVTIESQEKCSAQSCSIPLQVLKETRLSVVLLFPPWDEKTTTFLEKERVPIHRYGPFEMIHNHSLLEFEYWRDRLLELHEEVFLSPPLSWAQLWRDRRNPQQFWTFWVALAILVLTVISTAATVIQAWASVASLRKS